MVADWVSETSGGLSAVKTIEPGVMALKNIATPEAGAIRETWLLGSG